MAWNISQRNTSLLFTILFAVCISASAGCVAAHYNVSKDISASDHSCNCSCSPPPAANCTCGCKYLFPPPSPSPAQNLRLLITFTATIVVVLIFVAGVLYFVVKRNCSEGIRTRVHGFLQNRLVATITALIFLKWLLEIEMAGDTWIIFAVTLLLSSMSSLAVLVTNEEDAAAITRVIFGKQIGQVGLLLGTRGFTNIFTYFSALVALVSFLAAKSGHGQLIDDDVIGELVSLGGYFPVPGPVETGSESTVELAAL